MLQFDPSQLKIAGITPYSSIDYPGKFSAVVFVQGCPWRCLYCHNPHMQSRSFDPSLRHSSWSELQTLLSRRKGLLDAVVFSGGEPTLDASLEAAMQEVKENGFLIGLHTSGCYPTHLEPLLKWVDWIGLDIKASLFDEQAYRYITGLQRSEPAKEVLSCLKMIQAAGVDYECRTTAHPAFLPDEKLLDLAQELKNLGVKKYALQVFRLPPHLSLPFQTVGYEYPNAEVLQRLKAMFSQFDLRRG